MARHIFAKTSSGGRDGIRPSGKRRIRAGLGIALPLLVLLALLAVPAIVLASGAGPGVTVTPDRGSVGTHVNLNGSHFHSGDQITVGITTGKCSKDATPVPGAEGTVGNDGTFVIPFVWPNVEKGTYSVCAIDQTNGNVYTSSNPFEVLSKDPPSITVSGPVQAGQPVQVTGKNFLPGGGTAEVLYGPDGSNGCANSQGTANVGDDGSFTFTFNAPFTSSDMTIVVTAVEPQGSCGESPTLEAHTNVQVTAAATATPTPTATTAPTATATPGGGIGGIIVWPPSGPWTVVYCLIGLLALLLLLLLLLLLTRRRRQDQPATIQEQDRVVVAPNAQGAAGAGQGGQASVQRDIYAVDPRTQRRTPIAEEVTSVQEEYLDNPPGQGGQPPQGGGRP
jgi:MYXO-CTERM domain-containing protein